MSEQISDAKIKATEKEHSETFDSLFVNDGEKVRQVTKEKARELMGISGAETAIDKLNTDLASAVSEIQKNTEADAETKRKLDFLWKLNQGISYQYETDSASAYQKDIPSGAKVASVNKVGGKTVVWNQLFDIVSDGIFTENGITRQYDPVNKTIVFNGTATSEGIWYLNGDSRIVFKKNHKYLVKGGHPEDSTSTICMRIYNGNDYSEYIIGGSAIKTITVDDFTGNGSFRIHIKNGYVCENDTFMPMIFDLTQMFGSGNEPSTVAEFESMFPADYYPYDAGILMSAPVNEVVEQGKNLLQYPYLTTTTTKNGITFTDNGDGSISVKGTATSSTFFDLSNIRYHDSDFSLTATRTSYTVNDKTTSATGLVDGVGIVYNKDNKLTSIRVNSGATVDTTVCVQIEKSSSATEYSAPFKNIYPIPEAITHLDGYGWGITDDVCNYVDWENKTYHKRVGSVDLGTLEWKVHPEGFIYAVNTGLPAMNVNSQTEVLNAIISNGYAVTYQNNWNSIDKCIACLYSSDTVNKNCIIVHDTSYTDASTFKTSMSGVMLYYELAEEIVTDISDIIGDTFQSPFEVEAGGTLTFKNGNGDDYRIPVPNEEEYLIALAEVTA